MISWLLLLLLINQSEDVGFGKRAPADGADPSIRTPRVEAGEVEHMQARGLPN